MKITQIENSILINEDCLEAMDFLTEKGIKVDAIITDPPYNISRKNNFKTMGRAGIDFGEWDKDFDLTTWIKNIESLLKKGGNVIIFNSWKNMTTITQSLEVNGFEIKDLIRWKKPNAMPRNRDRRFITDYEVAVWAVKKGDKWTFNRLSETYEIPEIVCGLTPKSEKINGEHPTQKPIYVMKWLIERLTNEGNLILDPFAGSGTTGVACQNLNRKFIGIEWNPSKDKEGNLIEPDKYFKIAVKRMKENQERLQNASKQ